MRGDYNNLFKTIYARDIRPVSPVSVMERVHNEQRKKRNFRMSLFGLLSAGSLGILIPAVKFLLDSLASSGFYEYVSLLFSPDSAVYASLHEALLSIAESLPLVALGTCLAAFALFLWLGAKAARQALSVPGTYPGSISRTSRLA